jgi:hypothetical protein
MVIASGNVVPNLRAVDWNLPTRARLRGAIQRGSQIAVLAAPGLPTSGPC